MRPACARRTCRGFATCQGFCGAPCRLVRACRLPTILSKLLGFAKLLGGTRRRRGRQVDRRLPRASRAGAAPLARPVRVAIAPCRLVCSRRAHAAGTRNEPGQRAAQQRGAGQRAKRRPVRAALIGSRPQLLVWTVRRDVALRVQAPLEAGTRPALVARACTGSGRAGSKCSGLGCRSVCSWGAVLLTPSPPASSGPAPGLCVVQLLQHSQHHLFP